MTGGSDVTAEKAALRITLLSRLRALTPEERATRSAVICSRSMESRSWQSAQRILLFSPMRTEPDVRPLYAAATDAGKLVAVVPSTIRAESELDLPFTPDFVLVPGLGFSTAGHRLGRGGGFYDRLLAGRARSAFKLGVCFSLQLLETIPIEAHDSVLDAVISD